MELNEYTKEELNTSGWLKTALTVGKLKAFLNENNLPDDALVMVQRIEDKYFENNKWGVYLKHGEHSNRLSEHNKDIENGKYLDKSNFPDITPEHLVPFTQEQIKDAMEQYHPAFSCVKYHDEENLLFIDSHY